MAIACDGEQCRTPTQGVCHHYSAWPVSPFESGLRASQKLQPSDLSPIQIWLRLEMNERNMVCVHCAITAFQIAPLFSERPHHA
eukprot:1133578-Pelagomonas_calceolata.AAC.1